MQIRNLAVGAYAQGWTFWHYRHSGPCVKVMAHGFWRDATDLLRSGDFVAVSAKDGARLLVVADVDTQGAAMRVISA